MILLIVKALDVENDEVGVGVQVPEGWLDDPSKAETLVFGAVTMFQAHVAKSGIQLPLGASLTMHLEER